MLAIIDESLLSLKNFISSDEFRSLPYARKLKTIKMNTSKYFSDSVPKTIIDYFSVSFFIAYHKCLIHQEFNSKDVIFFILKYRLFTEKFFNELDDEIINTNLSRFLDLDKDFIRNITISNLLSEDLSPIHIALKNLETQIPSTSQERIEIGSDNYKIIRSLIEEENKRITNLIKKTNDVINNKTTETKYMFESVHSLNRTLTSFFPLDTEEKRKNMNVLFKELSKFTIKQ